MADISKIIEEYFSGLKDTTLKNLSYVVEGIMRCGRGSVWHAAQAMSAINNQSFKTNEKRYRLSNQSPKANLGSKLEGFLSMPNRIHINLRMIATMMTFGALPFFCNF